MSRAGVEIDDPWFSWSYVENNLELLGDALFEHLQLTLASVAIATVIAVPLGVAAARSRWASGLILSATGVLYTIPSLAVFALLVPFLGLSPATVICGLVMYALLILVRSTAVGLRQTPTETADAARGAGYGRLRMLLRIELPLALPSIMTGLRIATVSTVALVTVGAAVGQGGLGSLILQGFRDNYYKPQITTATVLCVALALIFEAGLAAAGRAMTPWARRG